MSDYLTLLKAGGSVSMEVRGIRYPGMEIYKTLNDLNPGYMNPKQAGGGAESAHRLVLPSAVPKR